MIFSNAEAADEVQLRPSITVYRKSCLWCDRTGWRRTFVVEACRPLFSDAVTGTASGAFVNEAEPGKSRFA